MKKQHFQVEEGDIFYKWSVSRIEKNKNVISATTGSTGSGKSLNDLRKAEIHYKNFFNENFPIKNCCFSISELMRRISSGKLRKGEVLILEEAGVNSGSADWQNKIVKMFNYVLQSFRSMNIILFMNLPVLSMLSKQARQLIHIHLETTGINFITNQVSIKPLVHQLNQHSGKSYWKYMRIKQGHKMVKMTTLNYRMPSPELCKEYELKKSNFLKGITTEFTYELDKKERKKEEDMRVDFENEGLTPRLAQAHELFILGYSTNDVAGIMHVSPRCARAMHLRLEQLKGEKTYTKVYRGIPSEQT